MKKVMKKDVTLVPEVAAAGEDHGEVVAVQFYREKGLIPWAL